jgi:hypothetical protein
VAVKPTRPSAVRRTWSIATKYDIAPGAGSSVRATNAGAPERARYTASMPALPMRSHRYATPSPDAVSGPNSSIVKPGTSGAGSAFSASAVPCAKSPY